MGNSVLTIDECNLIYRQVKDYLQKREEKIYNTKYDLLNTSDKLLVLLYSKLLRKKAEEIEEDTTKDLVFLEQSGIGILKSLENRLKPISSIVEKITNESINYNGSFERAANFMYDTLRYTFVINDDIYLEKLDECLHKLESMGYLVIDLKNKWSDEYYKDINVRVVSKNKKDIFEIQFHTPLSYRIKEGVNEESKKNSTRDLYRVSRDREAPRWLRARADDLRRYLQTFIKIPDGIIDYTYNSNIKRR